MGFNPLGQISEIKRMRDQAMVIQRQLQQKTVDVNKNGVFVRISGNQKIIEIRTNDKSDNDIKEAVNEAVKKSQEIAAKELSQMTGGMGGLGSLLGRK